MEIRGEWQVQEAKNKLSELLARVESAGPQRITRHGKHIAVVISEADFARLARADTESDAFVSFLLAAPFAGAEFERRRPDDVAREGIEF
ncbi:MAG: type II toxin-antitoxin system Phd/YefM family antitoxin [Vulcanimicrobiaceae bacterium]